MTIEAIASIVFGILQLSIGLVAFWQQRQLRRMQGEQLRTVIIRYDELIDS